MFTETQEKAPQRWHRRKLRDARDAVLLKQYKLSKGQRAHLIVAGAVLSQIAVPVASAIYFLLTQIYYQVRYYNIVIVLFGLRDAWNRLPVHVENLLHQHWFPGQMAPGWWIVARHDSRHLFIGLLVTLMIGAITVGLKARKRASTVHMVLSVPLAFLAAAATAAPLILLDVHLRKFGVSSSNPWVSDWLGKGNIQVTAIGILAAFPAKRVLARTMDTIQLLSLERHIRAGDTEQWWGRFIYLPNYLGRWDALRRTGYVPPVPVVHGGLMSVIAAFAINIRDVAIVLAVPVFLFLLGFGTWLLYAGGPATGVH